MITLDLNIHTHSTQIRLCLCLIACFMCPSLLPPGFEETEALSIFSEAGGGEDVRLEDFSAWWRKAVSRGWAMRIVGGQ